MAVEKIGPKDQEEWVEYHDLSDLKSKYNPIEYNEKDLRYVIVGEYPTPSELENDDYYMRDNSGMNIRNFVSEVLGVKDFDKECYSLYSTYLIAEDEKELKAINETIPFSFPLRRTSEVVLKVALEYSIPIIVFNSDSMTPGGLFENFFRVLYSNAIYNGAEVIFLPNFNSIGRIEQFSKYTKECGYLNSEALFEFGRKYTESIKEKFSNIKVEFYYSPSVIELNGFKQFIKPKALMFVASSNNKLYAYHHDSFDDTNYGYLTQVEFDNWDFKTYLKETNAPLQRFSYEEAKKIEKTDKIGYDNLDSYLHDLFLIQDHTIETFNEKKKFLMRLEELKECS